MPRRPMRPCSVPGCRELVERGRCDRHAKQVRPRQQERASAAKRGYDKRWQRLSKWYLDGCPSCQDCGELATEVHHIIKISVRPDLRLDEANCMALCRACHQRRTARGE